MSESASIGVEHFSKMGVGTQPANALADNFQNEDDLVDYLTESKELTEIDGVGTKSADLVRGWFTDKYPEKEQERVENDEAYCTEYTTDHGLTEEEVEDIDESVWAWICPRCGDKNPMKGDPSEFANRPYACVHCRWVPLLYQEPLMEFAEAEELV